MSNFHIINDFNFCLCLLKLDPNIMWKSVFISNDFRMGKCFSCFIHSKFSLWSKIKFIQYSLSTRFWQNMNLHFKLPTKLYSKLMLWRKKKKNPSWITSLLIPGRLFWQVNIETYRPWNFVVCCTITSITKYRWMTVMFGPYITSFD